jgi:tetratricopeptide (TPR) repeat protein
MQFINIKYVYYNLAILLLLVNCCLASSSDKIARNEFDYMYWQRLGVQSFECGDYVSAVQYYDKAVSLEPRDAYAMYYKGVALDELGRHDEAIKSYDNAICMLPDSEVFWAGKGLSLYYHSEYEAAIECFNKSIQLDPTFHESWDGISWALIRMGKQEEAARNSNRAIKAFDDAIKANPDETSSYMFLKGLLGNGCGQGGHNIDLTPNPESAYVGPYIIEFDLGNINHTILAHEGKVRPFYSVSIFFPDDCWNDCGGTNGQIRITIDSYPNEEPLSWNSCLSWDDAKRHKEIDGSPGWIAETNESTGIRVHAAYSLDHKGTAFEGNVSIDGFSAFRRYYDGFGLRGNSTIPHIMRLIDTIHIAKRTDRLQ